MKKNTIAYYIIGSALIWGLTIIGCALKLKETTCYAEISTLLAAGAGIHIVTSWGPMTAQIKKLREGNKPE